MKRLFIEGKYEGKLVIPKSILKQIPKTLVLTLPVQFLDFLEPIKEQLEQAGKKVTLFKSRHGKHLGQILGCDVYNFSGKEEAFLYIGDGKFHPTALLYENNKPVYCYNPFNESLTIYDSSYLQKLKGKKKGLLVKFLSSNNIGILSTTKPGQSQSKTIERLRERIEKKGKKVFVFLADNIDFNSLENFNFIDVWINTACPRIVEDFKALNPQDIEQYLN